MKNSPREYFVDNGFAAASKVIFLIFRLDICLKSFQKFFLVVIFLILLHAEAHSAELGLRGLVDFGLQNSPLFRKAKNDAQISELNLENASSKFLPELNLSSTFGYQGVDSSKNQLSSLNLTLTQPIYNNGVIYSQHRIAEIEKKKSAIKLRKDRDMLCLKIVKEFNSYSLATKIYDVQEFQFQFVEKQLKSIEGKYKAGEAPRIDYLRSKAQLQRARLSLQAAKNTQKKTLENIRLLIGWKSGPLKVRLAHFNENLPDYSQADAPLLTNHFDIKIHQLSKAANEEAISLVRKKYKPELYLSADAAYQVDNILGAESQVAVSDQINYSAILTIKYNIVDWGARRVELSVANLENDSANLSIDSEISQLGAEISILMLDLGQLSKNFKLNKELVDLEEISFKSVQADYYSGKTYFMNFVDAVDSYTLARQSFYDNYYNLHDSIAEYNYHLGEVYEYIAKD